MDIWLAIAIISISIALITGRHCHECELEQRKKAEEKYGPIYE